MFGRKKKAGAAGYNLPDVPGPDLAKLEVAMEKVQIEERIKAFYARSGGPGPAASTIARVTQEHLLHGKDHGEAGKIQTYGDVMSRIFNDDRSLSAVSGAARNSMASTMSFVSQFAPRRDPGIEHVAREIKGLAESIREARVGMPTVAAAPEKALPAPAVPDEVTDRIAQLEAKIDRLTALLEQGQGQRDHSDEPVVVSSLAEGETQAPSQNGATLVGVDHGMELSVPAGHAHPE